MTKEKLPTFRRWGAIIRRWGAKLLARKRAIIIVVFVIGGRIVGTNYLEQYYSVIVPCDQPCQDAINCDPLELTFEVTPTKIKLGQPNYLWYRARLKNRSCRRLGGVYVKEFLDSVDLRKSTMGLGVTVIGPDGSELERLPPPMADGGISWDYGSTKAVALSTEGTIYPYRPNYSLILQVLKSKKFGGSYFIDLNPGETFETITPLLRPSRKVAWSFSTEDGGIGDGYRWVIVENPPKFSPPPEGFNLLDRYAFNRPGRYLITAGFTGKLRIYPVFIRWENRARWLQWLEWLFGSTEPFSWDSEDREVNLVAPPVILEVVK